MNKLVSVIIPAFNVEKYITATVQSVTGQTYKNIEIIIVEDCSTDSTKSLIEVLAKNDSRIRLLFHPKNVGLASTRNTGLASARGEYLCIFDADDIMVPEKIEKQVQFLESHPECDITYSDAYHFLDGTKKMFLLDFPERQNTYSNFLKFGNHVNPNTTFFRRGVYDTYGGFDGSLRSTEDWDYWLTLSRNGVRFMHQAEVLTLYRVRSGGLTGNRVVMFETGIKVLEKQKRFNQKKEVLDGIDRTVRKWKLRLFFAKTFLSPVFELVRKIKSKLSFAGVRDQRLEGLL